MSDITQALPYKNEINKIQIKGSTLKEIFEHSALHTLFISIYNLTPSNTDPFSKSHFPYFVGSNLIYIVDICFIISHPV